MAITNDDKNQLIETKSIIDPQPPEEVINLPSLDFTLTVYVKSPTLDSKIYLDNQDTLNYTNSYFTVTFKDTNDTHTFYTTKEGYNNSNTVILKRTRSGVLVTDNNSGQTYNHIDSKAILTLEFPVTQKITKPISSQDSVILSVNSNINALSYVYLDNKKFDIVNDKLVTKYTTHTLKAPFIEGYKFVKWMYGAPSVDSQQLQLEINGITRKISALEAKNTLTTEENLQLSDLYKKLSKLETQVELINSGVNDKIVVATGAEVDIEFNSDIAITVDYEIDITDPIVTTDNDFITIEVPTNDTNTVDINYNITNSSELLISNKFKVIGYDITEDGPGVITLDFKKDFGGVYADYTVELLPKRDYIVGKSVYITIRFVQVILEPTITILKYPSIIQVPSFSNNFVKFTVEYSSINTNNVILESTNTAVGLPVKLQAIGTIDLNFRDLNLDYGINEFTITPLDGDISGDPVKFNIEFLAPLRTLTKQEAEQQFIDLFKTSYLETLSASYDDQDSIERLLRSVVNFGNDEQFLISNWQADNITFENDKTDITKNGSIILKLYEPLPKTYNINDQFWVSKEVIQPTIQNVYITGTAEDQCNIIRPANFSIMYENISTGDTGYQSYDSLVASGSQTSQAIIDEYLNKTTIPVDLLGIDFTNYDNFVHFSSANERLINFKYKKELVEFYTAKIDEIVSFTSSFQSPTVQSERDAWITKKNNVITDFDGYEKYLYTETGSTSWPKINDENYHSTSSEASNWFTSQSAVAEDFDTSNQDYLNNSLPAHMVESSDSDEFLLFNAMVGQHYDLIWTYIKSFENLRHTENKHSSGIPDGMLSTMLDSLGWNTINGDSTTDLWNYAFGLDPDGNELSTTPSKNRNVQIWRRILNNLPYLLKHKGSSRAIKALMSCYGVPSSVLSLKEYGGPKTENVDSEYIFQNNTFGLTFNSGSYLDIPFTNTTLLRKPDAIEFHFKVTGSNQDYTLISNPDLELKLIGNSGSFGFVELSLSGSSVATISSSALPIFDNSFYTLAINRESGSPDLLSMWIKKSGDFDIVQSFTGSIGVAGSQWESITSFSFGNDFEGIIDEFRLWNTTLNESTFNQHVLFRESYVGNYLSGSVDDLSLRLSFESSSNLGASNPSFVTNVAIDDSYVTDISAYNFINNTTFPYSYENLVRTNILKTPNIGPNRSANNKIRLESQDLQFDLNYAKRATKKAFDRAPIDSNRIGVYFSPTDKINLDIIKNIGDFDLSDFIGDPEDRYNVDYEQLKGVRDYYWSRFDAPTNYWDYIKLVRAFDRTMFDYMETLIPARSVLSKGLLIEPNILERSKNFYQKPTYEDLLEETSIDVSDTSDINALSFKITSSINLEDDTDVTGVDNLVTSSIDAEDIIEPTGNKLNESAIIDLADFTSLTSSVDNKTGSIDVISGEPRIQTEVNQSTREVIGFPDEFDNLLVGIYAQNGSSDVVTLVDGVHSFERLKLQMVTTVITELVWTKDTSDPADIEQLTEATRSIESLTLLPITSTASIGEPLDGYHPTHHRYTTNISTGLTNSFYNGSKQTSETTLDGSSPIEVFIANPNTLKVNKSGRDSAEPILQVD